MPDRYDLKNILDKGFEVANKVQRMNGQPPLDEVSWVYGFVACFGILNGTVDIGIDYDSTPLGRIMDAVEEDIIAFGQRVAENQRKQEMVRGKLNDG